jgi:hypothetical protein
MAWGRGPSRREKARPDIRGFEPRCSRTACGEVIGLTQGSPPVLAPKSLEGARKPNRRGMHQSGEGTEGGRSTSSTEDSGPEKPGNSAEEKTPRTGRGRTEEHVDGGPAIHDGQHTSGKRVPASAPPPPGGLGIRQPGRGKSWTKDDGGDACEPI